MSKNNKNNKNNMIVTTQKEHERTHCRTTVIPERKCATINIKSKGRKHLCLSGTHFIWDIIRAQLLKDSAAFGADGAYLAYAEAENETIREFEEACNKYK